LRTFFNLFWERFASSKVSSASNQYSLNDSKEQATMMMMAKNT
jgi:hypothetical protein